VLVLEREMRVAGVRCTKDKLDWAIVDGDDRTSAAVIEQVLVNIPSGHRGDGLAYVRKEVLEHLDRFAVGRVAVRVAETGGPALSPGRWEVEGVVQEALASRRIDQVRHVVASIRGAYKLVVRWRLIEPGGRHRSGERGSA
jgi:hypothetical protein